MKSSSNIPQDYGHPDNHLGTGPIAQQSDKKRSKSELNDPETTDDHPEPGEHPRSETESA